MPVPYRLGKLPHRPDSRIPRFSVQTRGRLPAPPSSANWYANSPTGGWGMLGNDAYGDCVEAAAFHAVEQFSGYAGKPQIGTEHETLGLYSAITGFNPNDARNTDNGTYVLGPGGLIEYWAKHGITVGGVSNKVTGFLQITHKDPKEWKQGIWIFGGLLVGFAVPESLMSGDTTPYIWQDYSGPQVGGHEVWVNGYETVGGTTYYDLVSWGQMYRATEQFLLNLVDETVVVVEPTEMNARGVNAAGFSMAQLLTDMWVLRQGNR